MREGAGVFAGAVRNRKTAETSFRACVLKQIIQLTKIKSLGAYGSFDFKHEAS